MDDIKNINLGGKANSLIKLQKLGLPVPEFFVLPATYFKRFVEDNKSIDEIEDLLINNKYKEIRQKVLGMDFSSEMKDYIYLRVNEINSDVFSVRSSANNEDGKEKSFAGQYETYLNVTVDNIFDSIKKCWLSVLQDNVVSYMDYNVDLYSVNVIIQRMINPEYAGVSFSIDPTSRSKNYTAIEICEGVGEKLVSGEVTPTRIAVNRNNLEIDLKIGDLKISQEKIQELEKYILLIEKSYKTPIDMEWCYLDNQLYILQARPITAHQDSIIPFRKAISRTKDLFEIEIYYQGEYFGIKDLTGGNYYFNPLFEVKDNYFTNIYYDGLSLEEFPPNILRELDKNYDLLFKKYLEIKEYCESLSNIMKNKDKININDFVNKLMAIQPFSSLGNLVGQDWESSDRVKKLLTEYRNKYDKIIYLSTEYLGSYLRENIPNEFIEYIPVMTLKELSDLNNVDINIIKERQHGYIFYDGNIWVKELFEFCDENGFIIESKKADCIIKGNIAYRGKITGKAKIILTPNDFEKFNDGDILVTTMTTPRFTSVMKKAAGIITDEGGITCHASIIARELKKPCLVGCKNATELLKDNMKIELDALTGAVNIL